MGITFLLDTNVVIYLLHGQFEKRAEKFIYSLFEKASVGISVITEIELMCWKSEAPKDIEILASFLREIPIIELDKAIKIRTAEIRKNHRIKLPDAIIAATSMAHELTLISNDKKDFGAISGLKYTSPYSV